MSLSRRGILASAGGGAALFDASLFRAYLTFNSLNGNDSSSFTNNFSENTAGSGSISYVDGLAGKSADLTTEAWFSSASTDFDITNQNFSAGMFINFDAFPSGHGILFGKHLVSGNQKSFFVGYKDSSTRLRTILSSDGSTNDNTFDHTVNLATGQYYHIVVTFEFGTAVKVYIDGALVETFATSVATSIFDTSANFDFGSGDAHTPALSNDGKIDFCFQTREVLTLERVQELYNSGAGLAASAMSFS